MNNEFHIIIGIVAAYIAYSIFSLSFQLSAGVVLPLIAAGLGSFMPDRIDYHRHKGDYKHRRKGHSRLLLKPLGIVMLIFLLPAIFKIPGLELIFYFCLGYFLHLLADSTTKMGIPNK